MLAILLGKDLLKIMNPIHGCRTNPILHAYYKEAM
jgi:hypothetical protein